MPKEDTDYSNTIIYKIACKDAAINDLYVGHTINFVQRKLSHKQNCNNPKSDNYQYKVYKTIRENGGWNNWRMDIIHFCNCQNLYEARIKEQEYFLLLHATLNSIEPMPRPKVLLNKPPRIAKYSVKCIKELPLKTTNRQVFKCLTCHFNAYKLSNYTTHMLTRKHLTILQNGGLNAPGDTSNVKTHKCICGSIYAHRQGLSVHKKKCSYVEKGVNIIV